MNIEFEVLSAFDIISETKDKINQDTLLEIRSYVSIYLNLIVSEEEFEISIEELRSKNFINGAADSYHITSIGKGLVASIGKRRLGETGFERLKDIIKEYSNGKLADRNLKVGEKLKSISETKQNKIKDVNPKEIASLGLLLNVKHKCGHLYNHAFQVNKQYLTDRAELNKAMKDVTSTFLTKLKIPIHYYADKERLHIISSQKIQYIMFDGKQHVPNQVVETDIKDCQGWNLFLVKSFIERALNSIGYRKSIASTNISYIRYSECSKIKTNAGTLCEHDALAVHFLEGADNSVFFAIDTYVSLIKPVNEFINDNLSLFRDKDALLLKLKNLHLRVMPSGATNELIDVIPDVDVTTEIIRGKNTTYLDYWKKEYGIPLAQRIQHLLVLKGFYGDFYYPAETVYIDRHDIENKIGTFEHRKPKCESPHDRANKIDNFRNLLEHYKDDVLDPLAQFDVDKSCPNLAELEEKHIAHKTVKISPPVLEFSNGIIRTDPMGLFSRYEPCEIKCEKKKIYIRHIIAPDDLPDKQLYEGIEKIGNSFKQYRFGSLNIDKDLQIIRYNKNDVPSLETKLRGLNKVNSENKIGFAVIPKGSDKLYLSLKRLFPSRTKLPLQGITYSSFNKILNDEFKGYPMLCLKILIKSLKKGEAIWTLAHPAGLVKKKTLILGIGFSRFPREGRVSKCAAVMHDSYGNKITWDVYAAPALERTITKQWFDLLLQKVYDEYFEQERPERILIYRTGMLYQTESEIINNSIREASWLNDIEFAFVSVLDSSSFRFCRLQNGYKNVPPGYGIVLNDSEGMISTSNHDDRELRQGTVVPVQLKIELGKDEIVNIMTEYHDLTYLYWLAPQTTAKQPLVLKIAQKFSERTRDNIPTDSLFYLDL